MIDTPWVLVPCFILALIAAAVGMYLITHDHHFDFISPIVGIFLLMSGGTVAVTTVAFWFGLPV